MKMILGLMLALAASPAVAADQFDLNCDGGKTQQHFRIDIQRGAWCREECKDTIPIVSISQTRIVLIDKQPRLRGDPTHSLYVDREAGRWHEYSWFPSFEMIGSTRDGNCIPAPFSGFPVIATKF